MYIEYNQNYHPLGKNLQLLRKQYALSRRALARLVGISEFQLKRLEDGSADPVISDVTLQRICQIFDIEANQLLFHTLEP